MPRFEAGHEFVLMRHPHPEKLGIDGERYGIERYGISEDSFGHKFRITQYSGIRHGEEEYHCEAVDLRNSYNTLCTWYVLENMIEQGGPW